MIFFNKKTKESGFGLMEILVTTYVISIALLSVLYLIKYTIVSSSVSSSRLIAANLAQEGIEIVRNLRDSNYGANGWDDWYASLASGDYIAQYDDTALQAFSDTPLLYDSSTGVYSYDGGQAGTYAFKRKITLQKNGVELTVTSQITWTEKDGGRTLTVEDHLWNWR